MGHPFFDYGLIILLASLAAIFSSKFRQQPMIGYVIAGVVIGPAVLGLIHDESDIRFFAEIGVILLLFLLGMELPLRAFKRVGMIAVPAAFVFVLLSLVITFGIGLFIEMTLAQKIVYGFIISLSSTAVAIKLIEELDLMSQETGKVVVSILVAQDLIFVPMVMVVNALGNNGEFDVSLLPIIAAAVLIMVGLIWFLLKKDKIYLPFYKTIEKHKELIPVAALAWCFIGAGLAEISGISPAYGAFLAGLVIGNSHSKVKVFNTIEPMQAVFLMVFFLSIGMLLDFAIIAKHWELISCLLLGAMLFKTVVSITLLKTFLPAENWRCSFVAGLTISQIGEFSFILAATALSNNILDDESYKIIIAVIALSLTVSPIWLMILRRFVQVTFVDKSATNMSGALVKLFSQLD